MRTWMISAMLVAAGAVGLAGAAGLAAAAAPKTGAPKAGASTKSPAKAGATKTDASKTESPQTEAPTAAAGDVYGRIVAAYMDGKWDDLDKALRVPPMQLARLPRDQQADVAYVRQALAECRPPWWPLCKKGQKTSFDPTVWGRTLKATYDPDAKSAVQMNFGAKEPTFTLGWLPADMDSTGAGEYGFLMGDLTNLGIWHSLGTAAAWSLLTPQNLSSIGNDEKAKLRLNLYSDFRGNVTGLYGASPPARRWGLHIYLAAYMEKYGKGPMAAARRAVAAMFMAEVLQAPARYPSLPLPATLEADAAEEKLAVHFKFKISRNAAWTIPEDKAFREAVKAFAAANDRQVYDTGTVFLPSKMVYALEAEADAPWRPKRDAWVKAQFDKTQAGPRS